MIITDNMNEKDYTIQKIENLQQNLDMIMGTVSEVDTDRVLVLSDLHIPFCDTDKVLRIIEKHKYDISTIIFGGDLIDCYSVSSFPKHQRISLIDEVIQTKEFLQKVDDITPNIKKIMFWGNHEYRFKQYLAKFNNELNFFHSDNILDVVRDTIFDSRNQKTYPALSKNFEVVDSWYYQYKKLIVAHPKNFSKVNMKTATMTYDYFTQFNFDFNAILIGHTHKWGVTIKGGKLLAEIGCCCEEQEYSNSGNLGYTPQNKGYALVKFKADGSVDLNSTRAYLMEG